MFKLYQANLLEDLAETLVADIQCAGADPLSPERVVVPNPGTGRWLIHRLAARLGIAANLEMPLPASFFWRVLQAWLPDTTVSPFDIETLVWRIQAALPELLDEEMFHPLRHYLDDDDPALRQYQLSQRIAEVFDQYLVFRPQMVLDWEAGEGQGWQPQLWRQLTSDAEAHRARLLMDLIEAMQTRGPEEHASLPPRLFLFGINALAPIYLEILRWLGEHRDVYLYHLNPCQQYWGDIHSEKSLQRHDDPQAALLEVGNPLLASFGHVGQVFLDQLLSLNAEVVDAYNAPRGDGVLPSIQRDILELIDGRDEPQPAPQEAWPSLQFHGAHTRFREVQILHNNLLRCFEALDQLTPRDILVMAPDMAAYAPFVDAVFGTAGEARMIPFSIGDRSVSGENPLANAVRWLLDLPGSRISATEVLALLEADAVQRRFDLDVESLEHIRRWVTESGIRWGIDANHRQALGLPADEGLHSWRFGLRRLFLGYVTPVADADSIYADGTVPYLDIEGRDLLWAGALQTVIDRLDCWRQALGQARTLQEWQVFLAELFDDFFLAEDDQDRELLQALHQRLAAVLEQTADAGFDNALPLSVVRELLEQALIETTPARGFLAGGVTFSNLLPMRALPFRVIALLGMNDTDFPRRQRPPSFDLMAEKPHRTDRERRRDDRYLFLETLVSARDCLLISWLSRDVRNDQPRLPAEVVTELCEYIDRRFTEGEETLSERLFVQHPLQPFDPRYFNGSDHRLFSYDEAWAIPSVIQANKAFVEQELAAPECDEVTMDELIRFFRNPAEAFLQKTLALRLPSANELPLDSEPFQLDNLEQWRLRDHLLEHFVNCGDEARVFAYLKGEGALPHGLPGALQYAAQVNDAKQLSARVSEQLEGLTLQTLPVALEFPQGNIMLTGELRNYHGTGVIDYRAGNLRPFDRLSLWIKHLAGAAQTGQSGESIFIAKDEILRLRSVEQEKAEAYLRNLLDLYLRGKRKPLKFFPKTAWAQVQGKPPETAWCDGFNHQGEGSHPAYRLVFGETLSFDDEFQECAEIIYRPLLEYAMTTKGRV